MKEEDLVKLGDYFKPEDLEWRIQQSGLKGDKPWAMVLVYVTNRAIMDRLDTICGSGNWRNEYRNVLVKDEKGVEHTSMECGISILIDRPDNTQEWVTKWDASSVTAIEPVKGVYSGSMKRAAVHWGIGRYLYKFPTSWAVFTENGINTDKIDGKYFKWNPPALPSWAIPVSDADKELLRSLVKAVTEYSDAGVIKDDWQKKVDLYISTKDVDGLQKVIDWCKKQEKSA